MIEIIMFGYLITIVGGIWAFIRLFQYSFGSHKDYIYVPPLAWISLIVGIWIPYLSYIVLAYILLWCKPVKTLMSAREQALNDMTSEDVITATEQLILDQNLISDEWVVDTWSKASKSEWVKRLSSKPELLKQSLEKNMEIHASKVEPYAAWDEVIKYYLYLDERNSINANI